jgi:Protein of unknown function (DUF1488)
MTLHFPNASRNYNPTRHRVCFWDHDSTFEVSFHVDEAALCKISPYANRDETSLLRVFDVNRARIEEAAQTSPSGRKPWQEVIGTAIVKPRSRKR